MTINCRPLCAALIGYYGCGNLGDELMLLCLKRWLKAQNIEITVITDKAERVRQQHGVPAVQNYPFLAQYGWVESFLRGKALRTAAALRDCDVVLCGGGDVIRDQVGWRTFSYQIEKLVLALLLGKPVYLLNVGLSRPRTQYGKSILKWLLPRLSGIVVRDARSVDICRASAPGSKVHLMPDIVRRMPELLETSGLPQLFPRTTVLVALHGDSHVYGKYEMTEGRISAFADLMDSLIERYGVDIEFFPFQPEDQANDSLVARKVRSRMAHQERAKILEWTLDVVEIAARYRRSRLAIAMRLHAAVLAATYGTPCVLMPYDQKVVEFGEQAQIRYVLPAELIEDRTGALEVLCCAISDQAGPPPLESGGDWMQLTLDSI